MTFVSLRLTCATILVIVAHLELTDAAVRVWGMRAYRLEGDPTGPPDPYLKVWCGNSFAGMTAFFRDTSSPSWNAEFHIPSCKANDNLKLEVWDKDLNIDDHLGTCITRVQYGSNNNKSCRVGKGSLTYNYKLS